MSGKHRRLGLGVTVPLTDPGLAGVPRQAWPLYAHRARLHWALRPRELSQRKINILTRIIETTIAIRRALH
jgi:hypothetical protein